ncbi:MGMT family protein [Candidatus Fermentibacterales bacterium]|nr:MGMT family protein [Candidatus Fermentibacterales bacterium]
MSREAGHPRKSSPLYERIYSVAMMIPRGRVSTYKQLSLLVGGCTPRIVGYAMSAVREGESVPWHRVVNSRGAISPRSGGEPCPLQRALLEGEGIAFDEHGRIDLERFGWNPAG